MKKATALLLTLIFVMSFVPTTIIAEEHVITVPASNYGHSGSAAGTGLFIGCVDDIKGNVHRAEFISGVTGNNSITVGSTRTGAIEFEIDGTLAPQTITRADLKVYVHDINGNLGNDWMLLAAYETENPKLTYSVGGMDNTLFPAVEDKYSYGAAFWSNEKCTKSDPGWKTLNVTRAVVNALKKDNGQSEKVRVVLRLQVPAAGLNISTDDNKPYMEIVNGKDWC